MNTLKNTSKNYILGNLRREGFTVPKFARLIGERPQTVIRTIYRYAGKNRKPRGRITIAILEKLKPYAEA